MQLSDLFEELSYGSLSNLSIGGDGSGVIPSEYRDRLTNLVNQGLKSLYRRFNILEREAIIRTSADQTIYYLRSAYADTNLTSEETKYIDDSDLEPFTDDVIKILSVFDAEGTELPLNDVNQTTSVYTPAPDTIQIMSPVDDTVVFVMYQAQHPKLINGDLTQEIELPEVLSEALTTYVAQRVYSGMSGQEATNKALELKQTYELLCSQINEKDLVNSSPEDTAEKFEERGFA